MILTYMRNENDLLSKDAYTELHKLIRADFCPAIVFMINAYLGRENIEGIAEDKESAYYLMNKLLDVSTWSIEEREG